MGRGSAETSWPAASFIRRRPIKSDGGARRCFITGINVWPPARYFASAPFAKRAAASSTEEGRWYVVSYMAVLPKNFPVGPPGHSGMRHLAQTRNLEEFNVFRIPGSTLPVAPECRYQP